MSSYPKEIFKAYDIRGIVGKTLTPEIVEAIGHAIGSEAVARKQRSVVIGRDGRLSGRPASTWLTSVVSPHRCCTSPPTIWAPTPA